VVTHTALTLKKVCTPEKAWSTEDVEKIKRKWWTEGGTNKKEKKTGLQQKAMRKGERGNTKKNKRKEKRWWVQKKGE